MKHVGILVTYASGDDAIFEEQLGIIGAGSANFALQGDSGAVVVDSQMRAIGLLSTVAEGVDVTYANPIGAVLDALEVSLV